LGGYKIRDKEGIHFVTFAVVEWIGVLAIKKYREIVLESLRATQDSMGIIASLKRQEQK
jgi:putative transposase